MRLPALSFLALLLFSGAVSAANRSSYSWDPAKPVDTDTLLFGETPREKKALSGAPDPSDKSYPWYCLEKGNGHFLNREYDRASIYFKAAYDVPGPTRVISGFRLIEAYQKLDQTDLALETLAEMEKKYLVSSGEFREATRLRLALMDRKRKDDAPKGPAPFTGKDWLAKLQDWRIRYVLDAMDELRRHGIPLKEEAQHYVFLLDEYFTVDPAAPAGDAVRTLADLVYERDPDARLSIDRWRMNPESTLTEEARIQDAQPRKLTGAEWVTMVHEDKMEYVSEAMKVLKGQRVPMENGAYAYTEQLDRLFTEKPELPAFDSVQAMASLLYDTEPEARKVLEALRLE